MTDEQEWAEQKAVIGVESFTTEDVAAARQAGDMLLGRVVHDGSIFDDELLVSGNAMYSLADKIAARL